jgi:hypothetical protein
MNEETKVLKELTCLEISHCKALTIVGMASKIDSMSLSMGAFATIASGYCLQATIAV